MGNLALKGVTRDKETPDVPQPGITQGSLPG